MSVCVCARACFLRSFMVCVYVYLRAGVCVHEYVCACESMRVCVCYHAFMFVYVFARAFLFHNSQGRLRSDSLNNKNSFL